MPLQVDLLLAAFVPLVLVAAGVVIAYAGYRKLEPEIRRLRDDPLTVREATVAEQPVELRGTVETERHYLEAPFTGADCVAYEFEIEEYQQQGKHSHWETLESGSRSVPFRLADDTGSILVEPAGAEYALDAEFETEVGTEETATGRIREFLERLEDVEPGEGSELSLGPLSVGTGDRRRYSEARLDVGESVSVFGRPERDPDAGGEWGSEKVDAALRADEDAPFVVADAPSVPIVRRSTLVGGGVALVGIVLAAYGVWIGVSALGAAL